MKSSKLVGILFVGLSLSFVGCEPPKPAGMPSTGPDHPVKGEGHEGSTGISTPVPPVDPSPLPEMPSTAKGDAARKEEAKPAEKKAEEPAKEPAKTEAPK